MRDIFYHKMAGRLPKGVKMSFKTYPVTKTETLCSDDPYLQMAKNDVSAENQLNGSRLVKFENPTGKGVRVMFVGNSITLHAECPEIGWYGAHGMAASSKEKDYVHLLEKEVSSVDTDAAFCICHASGWERKFRDGRDVFEQIAMAREFGADVIILRLVENCNPAKIEESELFIRELTTLLNYLDKEEKAKFIITTGFWRHPFDGALSEFACKMGYPCVTLGDLGENDAMKAKGLFEHGGVANHPGDLGMRTIADRIAVPLLSIVNEIKNGV